VVKKKGTRFRNWPQTEALAGGTERNVCGKGVKTEALMLHENRAPPISRKGDWKNVPTPKSK